MPVPVMVGALFATAALVMYLVVNCKVVFTGLVKASSPKLMAAAVVCDVTATVAMMVASGGVVPADVHGWIGYSALALMVVNLVLMRRFAAQGKATAAYRAFAACVMLWWAFSYSLGFMKMG